MEVMQDDINLKYCPFCLGEAQLVTGGSGMASYSFVMCKNCGAKGERFFISTKYSSDGKAINAWNTRH